MPTQTLADSSRPLQTVGAPHHTPGSFTPRGHPDQLSTPRPACWALAPALLGLAHLPWSGGDSLDVLLWGTCEPWSGAVHCDVHCGMDLCTAVRQHEEQRTGHMQPGSRVALQQVTQPQATSKVQIEVSSPLADTGMAVLWL